MATDTPLQVPTACTVCTATCTAVCGGTCTDGCSSGCTNTCTGTCDLSCTLECTGSCSNECTTGCGESCSTSCEIDCISTCFGLCQGCTGCSGSCEGTCAYQCMNTCQNEATNSGTTVVTEEEVLNYIANLKFKRISEFDENPAIFNQDTLVTVVDGTKPTYDALDAISILMENGEKKTFRATAAQLMDFLNRNLRNFIMWKPYSDGTTIRWERSNDDTEPEPINLTTLQFPMASEESDGIMSKEDFIKLKQIDITNYYTINEIDDAIEKLNDKYAPKIHYHDQYLTIENAKNTYYNKDAINGFLKEKAEITHDHDDTYLKITDAENDYATKKLLDDSLSKYTDTEELENILDKYVLTENALTIDKIPMASGSSNGLMSSTQYSYVSSIPSLLQQIKNSIPTKTDELINNSGFLTANTLPKAKTNVFGIVTVSDDSRISISDEGYANVKDFGSVNYIKNSTFANGVTYWSGDPIYTMTDNKDTDGEFYANFVFNSGSSIRQIISGIWKDVVSFSLEAKGMGILTVSINGVDKNIEINATEWTRYILTFDMGEMPSVYSTEINISNNTEEIVEVSLRHLMLQNGLFVTDWFPNYLDGNTITPGSISYASNDTFGIVKPDGTTIVSQNGVLTALSEINDNAYSGDKTWSSSKIYQELYNIPNVRLLGGVDNDETPAIRIVDNQSNSDGYGVIIKKTSDHLLVGTTALNDSFGDMTEQIGLRINLANGICDINGNAMTANKATYDADGNVITDTYLTTDDIEVSYVEEDFIKSLFNDDDISGGDIYDEPGGLVISSVSFVSEDYVYSLFDNMNENETI